VDDQVRICREACEPSNRGRFLEDQLLSPDDQKMFRGGIFSVGRTKISQRNKISHPAFSYTPRSEILMLIVLK
jgi:hypothetical protein